LASAAESQAYDYIRHLVSEGRQDEIPRYIIVSDFTRIALHGSEQQELDIQHLALIDVDAFYGIEIGELPARIAEVAMWLMDHQMNIRLSEAFGLYFVRLPLRKSPTVVCGNALRLDWKQILPPQQCSYVLGKLAFFRGTSFVASSFRSFPMRLCTTLASSHRQCIWVG